MYFFSCSHLLEVSCAIRRMTHDTQGKRGLYLSGDRLRGRGKSRVCERKKSFWGDAYHFDQDDCHFLMKGILFVGESVVSKFWGGALIFFLCFISRYLLKELAIFLASEILICT